jgi:predicted nucleic acid-binding protein
MRRLALDTCVLVSAMKSGRGASRLLVEWAQLRKIKIVLTTALASEYEDVLTRPEIRGEAWTVSDAEAIVDSLLGPATWIIPHYSYRPCLTDPGDEIVLEAAVNAGADIVTFNLKHFAPARRFGVRVYTPGEMVRILLDEGLIDGEE